MALVTSGEISIGTNTTNRSINIELGRSATTTNSNLNEAVMRTLANKTTSNSTIALSDFYGKSSAPPPLPPTGILDTFDRADGSLGSNWNTNLLYNPTPPTIRNNKASFLEKDPTNKVSCAIWSPTLTNNHYAFSYIYADVSCSHGITVRCTNARNGYVLILEDNEYWSNGPPVNYLELGKVVNGIYYLLSLISTDASAGWYRLDAAGTTITAKQWNFSSQSWVTLATVIDSSFSTGSPGIYSLERAGDLQYIDDFGAGNL